MFGKQRRVLRMMDKYAEKERMLTKIQPLIDIIVERALTIKENYLKIGNETGDFKISETEMGYIKRWMRLVFDKEDEPIMFLGMNIVVLGQGV